LTPDEILIMQEHCFHGYEILKKIPFLVKARKDRLTSNTQEKVRRHRAYPRGLKGEEISPGSADVPRWQDTLDAITS